MNKLYLGPDQNSGPRKLCAVCKVYYAWFSKTYRCPQCGAIGNAQDIIENSNMTLKADTPRPIVASKKKQKEKRSPDFPPHAQIIRDDTYFPA